MKKIIWSCTKPIRKNKKTTYTIYNNINEVEIKCQTIEKVSVVEKTIKKTLDRMNMKNKGGYS